MDLSQPYEKKESALSQEYINEQKEIEDMEVFIDDFKKVGLIYKIDTINHSVYVNRNLWNNSTNIDNKILLSNVMSKYFSYKNKSSALWCSIYDMNAGKKLASSSNGRYKALE